MAITLELWTVVKLLVQHCMTAIPDPDKPLGIHDHAGIQEFEKEEECGPAGHVESPQSKPQRQEG